jgi:hypothetical protein
MSYLLSDKLCNVRNNVPNFFPIREHDSARGKGTHCEMLK